jgi:hypothetical protein
MVINLIQILGLVDMGLALVYLVTAIANSVMRSQIIGGTGIILYIIQGIMAVVVFPLSGFILFSQGWRLDPILVMHQFLLHVLLIFLAFKDAFIYGLLTRQSRR